MKKPPRVSKRPAEYGAAGAYAALTGVLVAFGIEPAKAAAFAGLAAAVTPGALTYCREKGWL